MNHTIGLRQAKIGKNSNIHATVIMRQAYNIEIGEYCFNPERKEMRIFQSRDGGNSWSVAYKFKDGQINHIHGIFTDPFSDKIWVATGDDDSACVFGYTEDGFKTFVRKYEGS